jgi:hypothetical protein
MEEVDELVLKDLRNFGCNIPDNVNSIKNLDKDVFVNCVLRCLKVIDKDREYPRQLSKTTAHRVNQATLLVNVMMEKGYDQGQLSYHNLLYPNEVDMRKILMWLTQQLPSRDSPGVANDKLAAMSKLIEEEILFLTNPEKNIWAPFFCNTLKERGQNYYYTYPLVTYELYCPSTPLYYRNNQRRTPEMERYFSKFQLFFTAQSHYRWSVAPSVFEYNLSSFTDAVEREAERNTLGLDSGLNPIEFRVKKKKDLLNRMTGYFAAAVSEVAEKRDLFDALKTNASVSQNTKLTRAIEFRKESDVAVTPQETQEETEKRRLAEIEKAQQQLQAVEDEIAATEQRILNYHSDIRQLKATIQQEEMKSAALKKEFEEVEATMKLLENAEENIKKLQEYVNLNKTKLLTLAQKWEEQRAALVEQYRNLKIHFKKRKEDADVKLKKIKEMRREMKAMIEAVQKKEERYKQLLEVYKQLPKESRSQYTQRILEMVKNVKKQKVEINKILIDTRNLQKELNATSETLNRTFSVVEELVFADAKKDPVAAQTYKLVAALNSVHLSRH